MYKMYIYEMYIKREHLWRYPDDVQRMEGFWIPELRVALF